MEDFVARVLSQLPNLEDLTYLKRVVESLFKKNFSVEDAAAYCMCLEEVNPFLDEDIALARMKQIWIEYELPSNEAHSF